MPLSLLNKCHLSKLRTPNWAILTAIRFPYDFGGGLGNSTESRGGMLGPYARWSCIPVSSLSAGWLFIEGFLLESLFFYSPLLAGEHAVASLKRSNGLWLSNCSHISLINNFSLVSDDFDSGYQSPTSPFQWEYCQQGNHSIWQNVYMHLYPTWNSCKDYLIHILSAPNGVVQGLFHTFQIQAMEWKKTFHIFHHGAWC